MKGTTEITVKTGEKWTLSFTAAGTAREGMWLAMAEDGKKTVEAVLKEGALMVTLHPYEKDTPLVLRAENLAEEMLSVRLVWLGYRTELYVNGKQVDEEWPIGSCFHTEKAVLLAGGAVRKIDFADEASETQEKETCFRRAQYWAPEPGRINVGDCMPFFDGERYHLYYLKDRNSHQSKWKLGAHQYAHISSSDLVRWTSHPMAVGITHQWEGSICTGCIIRENDLYYAFYAVRMSNGTSARVTWATSKDGIHFEKSERYFSLHDPYESTSVRDPEVFKGEDGRFHMLLTTTWKEAVSGKRGDCLAHMISDDLENWEELPPLLIPGYTDQPECSNYFEWNGWYYLIFSNYGTAKYRYSRQPLGPWIKPEQEIIGSCLYRVPKTAAFRDNRRIAAGFLTNAPDGDSYAGQAIFRELIQREDGTLGTAPVPEMLEEYDREILQGEMQLKAEALCPYERKMLADLSDDFLVTASLEPENAGTSYGFCLTFENGCDYEVRLEPFMQRAAVAPLDSNPFLQDMNRSLYQVKGLGEKVNVTMAFYKGILDLYLDGRSLICRLKGTGEEKGCRLGCFVKDGSLKITDLRIREH